MDLGIGGKVALVTGASDGLGFAIAKTLIAEGVRVAICSRSADRVAAAVERLGHDTAGFVCDLGDRDGRAALIGQVSDRIGSPDILVLNSGGPPSGPFEDHDDARWTSAIDAQLGSAVALSRAALPALRERGWGRIITVTSCSLKQPVDGMILSTSARAAVLGFVRSLANEVAADGITVNNVMPGFTATNRLADLAGQISAREGISVDSAMQRWEKDIPMRRLGKPEEFAAVASFLCSQQAAYVTGASIGVDGGWIRSLI